MSGLLARLVRESLYRQRAPAEMIGEGGAYRAIEWLFAKVRFGLWK